MKPTSRSASAESIRLGSKPELSIGSRRYFAAPTQHKARHPGRVCKALRRASLNRALEYRIRTEVESREGDRGLGDPCACSDRSDRYPEKGILKTRGHQLVCNRSDRAPATTEASRRSFPTEWPAISFPRASRKNPSRQKPRSTGCRIADRCVAEWARSECRRGRELCTSGPEALHLVGDKADISGFGGQPEHGPMCWLQEAGVLPARSRTPSRSPQSLTVRLSISSCSSRVTRIAAPTGKRSARRSDTVGIAMR